MMDVRHHMRNHAPERAATEDTKVGLTTGNAARDKTAGLPALINHILLPFTLYSLVFQSFYIA